MPQLVVNMEVNTQNQHCSTTENYCFKMRHAAYSNRYHIYKKTTKIKIMKNIRLTLIVIILITSLTGYSQEKYATYDNTYIEKTYEVQISLEANNKFTFYIDALSLDNFVDKGGFEISSNQLKGFLTNLNQAKEKYKEWIKTAKANNVESLSKEIKIKSQKINGYFLYGGDWQFDFYVKPTFKFVILKSNEEIKYLLIVSTGELQSSSNEYIDCKGFVLVFSSLDEITHFETLFSEKQINEFKRKPNKEELFKD